MFKDLFSDASTDYARHRPAYPRELYDHLAKTAPALDCAWDCATGSGQAARGLAEYFARVIASDASAEQIAAAAPHPGVDYRVAPAHACGLNDTSVDLVTVAQALHWFDLDAFYADVRRVLRPGGILGVWTYNLLHTEPAIDELLEHFYRNTVGPCWPPERRWVENGYRDLPFPFRELDPPSCAMQADWTLPQLLGYLGTWSASKKYQADRGHDPVAVLEPTLRAAWGLPETCRTIRWPLAIRIGVHQS